MTETSTETEIAYRLPGAGGFKRRTFKTEAAAIAFADRLDDDAEIRWAR